MSEDIRKKVLCADCIGDSYLKLVVMEDGVSDRCSYCSGDAPTLPTSWLSDHIYETFRRILLRARVNMENFMREGDPVMFSEFECDGVPNVDAILSAAKIPERAANDVHDILKSQHMKRPVR
jgi:NMD protein affecting ribosome stability and mRNA decay